MTRRHPDVVETKHKNKPSEEEDSGKQKVVTIVQTKTTYEEDEITALHRSSWLNIKKERIQMPIIITILSAPGYRVRRDLIRASWLKLAPETRNKYVTPCCYFWALKSPHTRDNFSQVINYCIIGSG